MARSRFRRSPDALPPLRLTARDDAILGDIARIGPCLVDHLRRLHFPSYKTAAERAMKLFHHGFLERLPLPADTGQPAMAHVLGDRGRQHLADREIAPPPAAMAPHPPTDLRHAVEVAGILADFIVAARHPGVELPIVDAGAAGGGFAPHGLVVLDMPARLFRRMLLLDVAPASTDDAPIDAGPIDAGRLAGWKAWASRPPKTIEAELHRMLNARGVATANLRARVSIGLVVPDEPTLDAAARAAVEAGCGPLIHLAVLGELRETGPLGPVWTQARARANDGADARRTSVLAG